MNTNWIFGAALALTLAGSPALAVEFSALDTDANGKISKDEFYASAADLGIYSNIDKDNDGLLNEQEFAGLGNDWDYGEWDADQNGFLDSGEFYDGYHASYDADEDSHWNDGEWDDAGESGIFDW